MVEPEDLYAAPSVAEPGDVQAGSKAATRWRRLVALIIDAAMVMSGLLIGAVLWRWSGSATPASLLVGGLVVANVGLLAHSGQTVGKRITGIRIVAARDGAAASLWRVLILRYPPLVGLPVVPVVATLLSARHAEVGTWLPLIALGCHLLWLANAFAIFGEGRRCGHDYLGGTKVVEEGDPHR